MADLYSSINAYAISIHGKFIQRFPYLVLLPYMEIAMTHTAYFHFLLISKTFFSFLLIWSVCSSKCTLEKLIVLTILNFQKIKKELGKLFGSKNPKRGKYTSNRAFNYWKWKIWENLKSRNKSILVKKKAKQNCYSRCWKPWTRTYRWNQMW